VERNGANIDMKTPDEKLNKISKACYQVVDDYDDPNFKSDYYDTGQSHLAQFILNIIEED